MLAVLLCGTADDPLKGELEICSIANLGEYEPLSSVWGKPDRTHQILLGKGELELRITTSLYSDLRPLTKLFW
jgi:hypothetical protein